MPSLTKLVAPNLPTLKKGRTPELRDFAIWRLEIERWARGMAVSKYITGPLGEEDTDAELLRDGLRYIIASIEDTSLSGDITAGQGFTMGHRRGHGSRRTG